MGSGKSTVARIFEILGIPVYDADKEAKRIMNEDSDLRESIIRFFGEASYKEEGIDRAYIASIVFMDKSKLDQLNALVHPAVMKDGEAWMKKQNTVYAIHEAALIFEAGVDKRLDKVIGVQAPLPLCIQRSMERDNRPKEEIIKRMNQQMDMSAKMKLCDFIIVNDEQEAVIPQVLDIHQQLLAASSKLSP